MFPLVELTAISPNILLDIRYATSNNFTGQAIYPSHRCFLLPQTAEKLHRVQLNLEKQGLGLKVFDGYRPLSVQKIFWEICPDDRYVANPAVGSKHNRGAAVDVTLAGLEMPTAFDDFTEKAHHGYQELSKEALKNRATLLQAMSEGGFLPSPAEWWHYDDADWEQYAILDLSIPFR